jgi:hypothetical protein
MFNYKSIRSSEPQIRSNPSLRQVNENSGFQKRLSTLLEPIQLPFPTFQILRENGKQILENHVHYAWIRPAHIRSTWIILTEDMPLLMVDPKDSKKMFSLRIAFDKRKIQHTGPIIMEGAWDAQDHVLWIWDVIYWMKKNIWETDVYSKRWETLKTIVNTILDCGHPMSDAEIKLPTWESLEHFSARNEFDTATSVEFQPEKSGKRRMLYLMKTGDVKYIPTSHHERKMAATLEIKTSKHNPKQKSHELEIKHESIKNSDSNTLVTIELPPEQSISIPSSQVEEKQRVAMLCKDTFSKLPDTYRLKTIHNEDLGLAAIRSLAISKQIREILKTKESIMVDIQWFEPFQKYEIKKIHG